MMIAVDVGNTHVVVGGFTTSPEPVFIRRLPSHRNWTRQDRKNVLESLLSEACDEAAEGAALSSVVPKVTESLRPALEELVGSVVTVDSLLPPPGALR